MAELTRQQLKNDLAATVKQRDDAEEFARQSKERNDQSCSLLSEERWRNSKLTVALANRSFSGWLHIVVVILILLGAWRTAREYRSAAQGYRDAVASPYKNVPSTAIWAQWGILDCSQEGVHWKPRDGECKAEDKGKPSPTAWGGDGKGVIQQAPDEQVGVLEINSGTPTTIQIMVDKPCWLGVTDRNDHSIISTTLVEGTVKQVGKDTSYPVMIRSGCPGKIHYSVDNKAVYPENLADNPNIIELVKLPE